MVLASLVLGAAALAAGGVSVFYAFKTRRSVRVIAQIRTDRQRDREAIEGA